MAAQIAAQIAAAKPRFGHPRRQRKRLVVGSKRFARPLDLSQHVAAAAMGIGIGRGQC